MTPGQRFFLALLLGVAPFLTMYLGTKIALKRKFFPWYLCFQTACLAGAAGALGSWAVSAMVAPVLGLITFAHFRETRYCNACDRAHQPSRRFTPTVCSQCGGPLH